MKQVTINSDFFWSIIGIIFFKFTIDYLYTNFTSVYYDYFGFTFHFDILKYLEGWIVLIITFFLLYYHKWHNIYLTLLIIFLIIIIPTTTLYAFADKSAKAFYMIVLPFLILLFLISRKKINLHYIPHGKKIAIAIATVLVFVVLLHYLLTVGISHINFDLSKVYELRRSELGLASNAGVFGYLNSWVTKVFNIFLITLALWKRKFFLAGIFISIQILLFGFSGHKSVLFSLLLIFGLYFFERFKFQTTIVIYSFLGVILVVWIYFIITEDLLLPSIIIRRVFFVPTQLNFTYIDYFNAHEFLYWSNSIFKHFITYPYDVPPVFIIGEYMGYPEAAANTGLFGSGYMQAGIFGILFYIFIMALVINILQQFKLLPKWIINAIILIPMLSVFISSDLPTTFLTHGLLIAIIIVYLYSTPNKRKRKRFEV